MIFACLFRMIVYAAYLCFQLYSHTSLYDDKGEHTNESTNYAEPKFRIPKMITDKIHLHYHSQIDDPEIGTLNTQMAQSPLSDSLSPISATDGFFPLAVTTEENCVVDPPGLQPAAVMEDEEQPKMSFPMTIGLLVVVAVVSPSRTSNTQWR